MAATPPPTPASSAGSDASIGSGSFGSGPAPAPALPWQQRRKSSVALAGEGAPSGGSGSGGRWRRAGEKVAQQNQQQRRRDSRRGSVGSAIIEALRQQQMMQQEPPAEDFVGGVGRRNSLGFQERREVQRQVDEMIEGNTKILKALEEEAILRTLGREKAKTTAALAPRPGRRSSFTMLEDLAPVTPVTAVVHHHHYHHHRRRASMEPQGSHRHGEGERARLDRRRSSLTVLRAAEDYPSPGGGGFAGSTRDPSGRGSNANRE